MCTSYRRVCQKQVVPTIMLDDSLIEDHYDYAMITVDHLMTGNLGE